MSKLVGRCSQCGGEIKQESYNLKLATYECPKCGGWSTKPQLLPLENDDAADGDQADHEEPDPDLQCQ